MIKLSIIVPHYNSVNLLKKLLESIPKKKEIEIIVVDDRSNRKLEELKCMENNYQYDNVRFLRNYKNKKGAGVCRNIGLKEAKGEWVLFADADDFFVEEFYDIIAKFFSSDYEVIFFNPTSVFLDTGKEADRHLSYRKIITNYIEKKDLESEVLLRYCFAVPWSKLIKRDFIENNNIYFDEVIASNDKMFSTKVGYFMNRFHVSKDIIYCVTRNKGSLTVNVSEEVFDSRLDVHIDYCNFLKGNLKKEELKYLSLTGQGFIFFSLKYRYSFKKIISTYSKVKRNNIKIFEKKLLNPNYLINKFLIHKKKNETTKEYIKK